VIVEGLAVLGTFPPRITGLIDKKCIDGLHPRAYRGPNVRVWRGVHLTNQDTRRRLLISRHIAKMTPEEIERRFTVSYIAPLGAGTAKQPRERTRVTQPVKAR